jgi:hypothetical protein
MRIDVEYSITELTFVWVKKSFIIISCKLSDWGDNTKGHGFISVLRTAIRRA